MILDIAKLAKKVEKRPPGLESEALRTLQENHAKALREIETLKNEISRHLDEKRELARDMNQMQAELEKIRLASKREGTKDSHASEFISALADAVPAVVDAIGAKIIARSPAEHTAANAQLISAAELFGKVEDLLEKKP